MKLSDEQRVAVESKEKQIIVVSSAGSGKAQPNDTVIPTPTGEKLLGDIRPGDYVFGRDGKPQKVLQIFPQGKKKVFIVKFADGRQTECCEEHLWSYDGTHGILTTKTLKEMLNVGLYRIDKKGARNYKFRVPTLKKAVEYSEKEFKIHPYIIGAFIGDGCCTEPYLTLSSSDEFIVNKIADLANLTYKKRSQFNFSWDFKKNDTKIKTKEFFKDFQKELCVYCQEKFIPEEYFYGSVEQRMDLLRGLMDTDGYTSDGRHSPQYATNSYQLAKDVEKLARSLGYYSKVRAQDRRAEGKNIEYAVNIFTGAENVWKIFSLPRKVDRAKGFSNYHNRIKHNFDSIIEVEETDIYKEMTCLLVENKDHLYLTNDFIITHNTRVLTERLKWLLDNGEDPSQIFAITFTNMAAEEMKQRIGDKSNGCYIGTIHGLANWILLRNGIDTSKVIDEENFDQMFEMIIDNHCKIPKVNHLLVDEFQDTGENEYNFLMFTLRPDHYFLIGDTRQKIYGFKTGPRDFFQEQIDNPFTQVYELVDNYRSHYEIIRFGGDMIKKVKNLYRTPTRCVKGPGGQVITEEFSWASLLKYLGKYPSYKDWFILCRTNQQVDNILSFLKTINIPAITFRKSEKTLNEIKEDLDAAAVKVLTIHQSKGLESKYVMVYGAKFYNDEERRIDYVAATRAEELLIWFEGNEKGISRKRTNRKQEIGMAMENWG